MFKVNNEIITIIVIIASWMEKAMSEWQSFGRQRFSSCKMDPPPRYNRASELCDESGTVSDLVFIAEPFSKWRLSGTLICKWLGKGGFRGYRDRTEGFLEKEGALPRLRLWKWGPRRPCWAESMLASLGGREGRLSSFGDSAGHKIKRAFPFVAPGKRLNPFPVWG